MQITENQATSTENTQALPETGVGSAPFDGAECLKRFKAFQTRSTAGFSSLYDRIKHEKSFVAGKQWGSEDDKFVAKARNRITVNVLTNQCNSVANQYAAYPYTWATNDQAIDKEVDDFFKIESNSFAIEEAVSGQVSFGMGVIAIGSDTDAGGKEVPVIYSVTNPERVLLDPDSTELDGSDMMEAALIDYRSREWIRVNMGEQYLPGKREKMICVCASCATLVPIITYYWVDTDGCHTATFVNNTYSEGSHAVLSLHRVPVFPVWGEKTWEDDNPDKDTYQGLVAKGETVQRIVNYSFTQLIERLQLSPKPMWKGYAEAFKDLDKYYKRAGTGENTVIPGNRIANDKKTQLPLPERIDNTIQYQDIQGIVQGTMNTLTSVTGVDSKGLADVESDITATAALYTAKVFHSNIRHFYSHLKATMKALGDAMMVLMGHPGVRVSVVQGPSEQMENQTTLQVIMQLLPSVDPAQKLSFITAALRTQPNNAILADLYAQLASAKQPTPAEMQANQLLEQANTEMQKKDAEILQLRKQVESQNGAYVFELKKMELKHRYDMEELALKAQLSQTPADFAKAQAEVAKAELSVEKEALSLEREEAKTADDQAVAAMMGGI